LRQINTTGNLRMAAMCELPVGQMSCWLYRGILLTDARVERRQGCAVAVSYAVRQRRPLRLGFAMRIVRWASAQI
jgi:uncharacterized membrane protein YhfC